MRNFLELQCLVDDFRTVNVYQYFFTLSILFDEVDWGLGSGKKKNVLLDTICIVFSFKNCYG